MKHKYSFSLLALFFIFISFVCIFFIQDEKNSLDRVSLSWNTPCGIEQTYLHESDGIYYGFLPAYADADSISVHSDIGCTVLLNGIPWDSASPVINQSYTLSIQNAWNRTVSEVPFILMQSENIPALSIQLKNGTMSNIEKLEEKSGQMTLISADCDTIYDGDLDKFHIRGNHTATLDKKPYALKFSQEVDLLRSGGYTTYCLVANADDESQLRNKLVYETAQAFDLAHSPESMYVDLYVNNNYYGLYLLTEKIDVHENRINVNPLQDQTQTLNYFPLKQYDIWESYDSGNLRRALDIPIDPNDITGGYLLEMEVGFRIDDNINTFVSDSGQIISVKYPAACSSAQINYIADFYQAAENAAKDGTFLSYIDLESFAKFYLIQEFFAQIDRTSIFFYKNSDAIDPKLYAGPVWDFDWSFGLSESYSDTLEISPYRLHFTDRGLFQYLWNHDTFRSTVAELYKTEFRSIVQDFLPNAFDEYEQQIAASHAMDKCRWDSIFLPPHGPYAGSLSGSISILEQWLSQRISCFEEIFGLGKEFVKLSLVTDDPEHPFAAYSLSPNSYFSPHRNIPVKDGHRFVGWYDTNGNLLTEETCITRDIAFYAKWEPDPTAVSEEDSAHAEATLFSRIFKYTSPADYCILMIFAGLGIFVPLHMARTLLSSIHISDHKRSSHDK